MIFKTLQRSQISMVKKKYSYRRSSVRQPYLPWPLVLVLAFGLGSLALAFGLSSLMLAFVIVPNAEDTGG